MKLFNYSTLVVIATLYSLSSISNTFAADEEEKDGREREQERFFPMQIMGERGEARELNVQDQMPCVQQRQINYLSKSPLGILHLIGTFLSENDLVSYLLSDPREIAPCAKIRYIRVGRDYLITTGDCLTEKLRTIQHLSMTFSVNEAFDTGFTYVSSLLNLRHLILADMYCSTNAGLKHISSLLNLRHLELSWCVTVADTGLKYVSSLLNLQHLGLISLNNVTDTGLEHIRFLPELQCLNLDDLPKITTLQHVSVLPKLQHLKLASLNGERYGSGFFWGGIGDVHLQHLARNAKMIKSLSLENMREITNIGLMIMGFEIRDLKVPLNNLNLQRMPSITDDVLKIILDRLPNLQIDYQRWR